MPIVTSAPIEKLCWQPDGAAGVRRHAILAEAGYYFRHLPCAIDVTELEPWASQYAPLSDSSVQRAPQVVCYELSNACVTSQGCVITRDGHVVRESLGDLMTVPGLRIKGLRPLDEQRTRFEQDLLARRHIGPPALLLKRAWWRNFGHWLLEAAAPLALLRARAMLQEDVLLVTGAYEEPAMRAVVDATLRVLWPWPQPVVLEHEDDEMVQFDRLYYTTPVHQYVYQQPGSVQALRSHLVPPPSSRGPRRIFIERAGMLRDLVNRDEVRALCVAYGCEPVNPIGLPLLEQVRLFRDAELIVGTKGSDFVNAIFCAPWATVVVLSPGDFPDPLVWDIAAHGPLNYFELFGAVTEVTDVTGRNPFAIRLDKLRPMLDAACAPLGPGCPRNRRRYAMKHWMHHGYMPWLDRPARW